MTDFDRHPLRIFPTPQVPDEITHVTRGPGEDEVARDAILALQAANSKNYLIGFEFCGAPGFVERLPDYEDRQDDLIAGRERILPTAVMVGEVGLNRAGTLPDLERWMHPQDILMLLTLASGTEVGASWIELRDAQGRLVRRFHRQLRQVGYFRGHRLVNDQRFADGDGHATGIGHLISSAEAHLDALDEMPLRSSISHLVRSKRRDQSLDESLAHLCRGLDGLCEHFRVARQNLTRGLGCEPKGGGETGVEGGLQEDQGGRRRRNDRR